MHTSNRVEEEVDAQNSPCGNAVEDERRVVTECKLYKEERDVLERKREKETKMAWNCLIH